MTSKNWILVLVVVGVAAWVAISLNPRDGERSEAGARATSEEGSSLEEAALPAKPTLENRVPAAAGDTPSAEPPRVAVRIEGDIFVQGHASSERFKRMSVLAISESGVGATGRIADNGTFLVEFEARAADIDRPFLVSLDTEAGQRLRRSIDVHADLGKDNTYVGTAAFEISDRCIVRGKAVDEDGQPLPGVDAALVFSATKDQSFQIVVHHVTGMDGSFWLETAPQEELLLILAERKHRPDGRRLVTLGGEIDVGTIVLLRGETISGTLDGNEVERSVSDLRVLARRRTTRILLLGDHLLDLAGDTLGRWYAEAPVEGGRFVLQGLDPGAYTLQVTRMEGVARLPGIPGEALAVEAPAADVAMSSEETQVWFRLQDARTQQTVSGKVRMTGAFGEFSFPTDRQGRVLVFVMPDTDYSVAVDAPGYEHAVIEVRSSQPGGSQLVSVPMEPIEPGHLTLTLDRDWSGRGRISLTLQGDDRAETRDVDIVDGGLEVRTLRSGIYTGTLELWGAGELRGLGADEEIELDFDLRIRPGETAEMRLSVR
jgi:hypothetical protein